MILNSYDQLGSKLSTWIFNVEYWWGWDISLMGKSKYTFLMGLWFLIASFWIGSKHSHYNFMKWEIYNLGMFNISDNSIVTYENQEWWKFCSRNILIKKFQRWEFHTSNLWNRKIKVYDTLKFLPQSMCLLTLKRSRNEFSENDGVLVRFTDITYTLNNIHENSLTGVTYNMSILLTNIRNREVRYILEDMKSKFLVRDGQTLFNVRFIAVLISL